MISSEPAALAELKTERRAAKAAFEAVKVELGKANAAYEDCMGPM